MTVNVKEVSDDQKIATLKSLLEANGGTVSVAELVASLGTARRARRAVFVARNKLGMKFTTKRVGRVVQTYTVVVENATQPA